MNDFLYIFQNVSENDLEILSVSTYIAKWNVMANILAILQHMSFAKLLCFAYFEIQLST